MVFALSFFVCLFSFAHQSSLDGSGHALIWANPNIPVAVNPNSSDLTSTQINTIIQNSISQWNAPSSAKIIPVSSSSNTIEFVSNFPYGSGVLGITELSYSDSGVIDQAKIFLNDDYIFKGVPGLYPSGQAFLGDVVTHELGHLFGLSHSEVLNSSMFYSSYSGQSTISEDDKSGIRSVYDNSFGTIEGQVMGGNGIGVLGVHVQAISRRTGESSSAISLEDGSFRIGGLALNDTYYIYTSPIKNVSAIPSYFGNAQDDFCPGAYVGGFFTKCGRENDGKPQGINVSDSIPHVDVGVVTIHCSLKTDTNYDVQKLQSSLSPLTIYDFLVDQKHEKSHVGWFRKSTTSLWSTADNLRLDLRNYSALSGTTKYLKLSLVSYPFGSQSEYEMTVSRNNSVVMTKTMSYSNSTQTYNPDLEIYLSLGSVPSENIYDIALTARKLSAATVAQTFPAFDQFSSSAYLPYLMISSIYEMTPQGMAPILDTGANLSDNYSCLDAPFTYPVKKVSAGKSESESPSNSGGGAVASCGTIDPPDSGSGNSSLLLVSGFLLVFLFSTALKSRKKFLS